MTDDATTCDHPSDAIYWNPYNQATQCHRCGHTFPGPAMPSGDAMRWAP